MFRFVVTGSLLALVALCGCRQLPNPAGTEVEVSVASDHRGGGGGRGSAAMFEIRWMQNMIDHHAMAVEMTALAPERATHEEFRQLAAAMHDAQQSEIELMQGWLQSWYDIDYEPRHRGGPMLDELASLTGSRFESAFMLEMIPHHAMAIMMARAAEQRARHDELVALARDIQETQGEEIASMTTWLCEWYDVCGVARRHMRHMR